MSEIISPAAETKKNSTDGTLARGTALESFQEMVYVYVSGLDEATWKDIVCKIFFDSNVGKKSTLILIVCLFSNMQLQTTGIYMECTNKHKSKNNNFFLCSM